MSPPVEKTDFLGEPLIDIPWSLPRGLTPGSLADIHYMLSEGYTTEELAAQYGCPQSDLEAFILQHRNVKILRVEPTRFSGVNVVKPNYRNGGR